MSLRLAVLGLLDLEPGSGYTLLQRFRHSLGFFWSTTHQQLYRELHSLQQSGWLDCETVAQNGRPDQKVYRLNTDGEAELSRLLLQPAAAMRLRDPWLVKLFSGRRLPNAHLRSELQRQEAQHRQTLQTYLELQRQIAAMPAERRQRYHHPELSLRLGIAIEQAWLQWSEEIANELPPSGTA